MARASELADKNKDLWHRFIPSDKNTQDGQGATSQVRVHSLKTYVFEAPQVHRLIILTLTVQKLSVLV